ncbi:hypothetical protein CKK33_09725 [Mucilaginibacter sp. MD40]|nr:hypothetical protein CKK33_09725 [Mucilaginibacter sp. MD40]
MISNSSFIRYIFLGGRAAAGYKKRNVFIQQTPAIARVLGIFEYANIAICCDIFVKPPLTF